MIIGNGTYAHTFFIDGSGYLNISRKNNNGTAAILIGDGNDELYIRSATLTA
jgi:hypothetical protein